MGWVKEYGERIIGDKGKKGIRERNSKGIGAKDTK
jgi:hypothetical protein